MSDDKHGGDLYGLPQGIIDFSTNISPCGCPEAIMDVIFQNEQMVERYPDPLCRDLISAIAQKEGVAESWVHCGNGAADLIFRIVQARNPRHAMILAPTFSEYERALRAVDCGVQIHRLHEKDGFGLTDAILGKIEKPLDMLLLCNPNNPTGQIIEQALFRRILQRCAERGVDVVVDECFNPFLEQPAQESVIPYLQKYPNLAVLKAFTKLYAMPGLRLGYFLSSNLTLHERVAGLEPPWNVSGPAQAAGIAALAAPDYVKRVRDIVQEERKFLKTALRKIGLQVIGSHANYLFFKCNRCRDLREKLMRYGILIRSCENYRGLDERFYRMAVKSHPENERLVEALKKVLAVSGEGEK